jgi:hypothetical protein
MDRLQDFFLNYGHAAKRLGGPPINLLLGEFLVLFHSGLYTARMAGLPVL